MGSAPGHHKEWTNFAFLRLGAFGFGFTGFIVAMDTMILPVLVLTVAPEGIKNTSLGMLGFSGLIVVALLQPLVGWYSDRTRTPLGRRIPFMLWGCFFVCAGMVGIGLAPNYLALFGVWLFIQANVSVGYGPYLAVIRDLVPLGRVGVASAFKILADSVGAVALIAVSGALVGRYTGPDTIIWLWLTLLVMGASLVVSTAITSLTVWSRERTWKQELPVSTPSPLPRPSLHPQLNWFLLSRLVMLTATFVYPTYGLFFLRDAVGVSNPAQVLGIVILSIGGALALSVYPAGWLSDRIGRKPVIMLGAGGASAGSILILYTSDLANVVAVASLIGASVGVILSASWAMANELGTKGREGLHMGVVNLSTVAGAAIAKVLGPGVDLLNAATPGYGYSALLVSCATLFLLGAALLLPIKLDRQHLRSAEDSPGQMAR